MGDYIIYAGTVMTAASLLHILLPQGTVKNTAATAIGFVVISALLAPLGKGVPHLDIKLPTEGVATVRSAEKAYRAQVIEEHKKNLAEMIEKKLKHGGRAFVETDGDGAVTAVTLYIRGDESGAAAYIVTQMGVPRERIEIIYENN